MAEAACEVSQNNSLMAIILLIHYCAGEGRRLTRPRELVSGSTTAESQKGSTTRLGRAVSKGIFGSLTWNTRLASVLGATVETSRMETDRRYINTSGDKHSPHAPPHPQSQNLRCRQLKIPILEMFRPPTAGNVSSRLNVTMSNEFTHQYTGKGPAQRRGPKGYFHGSRKEFLESQVPAYSACKKGSRQNFWHGLYCGWWERFPWKLGDNEEAPADDPDKMASLASVEPGEADRKAGVEKQLTTVR